MERRSEAWAGGDGYAPSCLACRVEAPADPFIGVERHLQGTPGGSARAEARRRAGAGHSPWSTARWAKGADGESRLSTYLHRAPGRFVILDDRRIPSSRANIDLIAVAPSGVYVIDAKNYRGKVQRRVSGVGRWRREQLLVRGRDQMKLVDGMGYQVDAVRGALRTLDPTGTIPVHTVVCFVGSSWDPFCNVFTVNGVLVTAPGPLRRRLRRAGPLNSGDRVQIARLLSLQLPPAVPDPGVPAGRATRRR